MKRLVNSPETQVADALDGFAAAHADIVALGPGRKHLRRRLPNRGKVALISGGGSGHEPLHAGFVGRGMLDAACPGQIFSSPTPDQIVAAADDVTGEAGALFIVKNYAGDRMNFDMATELLRCRHATVLVDDDVCDEASARSVGRRGVAGTLIVEKMLGAASERAADLDALVALGRHVLARTRSLGVGLSYCHSLRAPARALAPGPNEMELGVGIHGEPGRRVVPLASADEIANELVDAILRDLGGPAGKVLLLVNGFGGTPLNELYIMYNSSRRALEQRGLTVTRSLVGNFVTSLDMAGVSATVCDLDDEMEKLWDDPVHTAALRW